MSNSKHQQQPQQCTSVALLKEHASKLAKEFQDLLAMATKYPTDPVLEKTRDAACARYVAASDAVEKAEAAVTATAAPPPPPAPIPEVHAVSDTEPEDDTSPKAGGGGEVPAAAAAAAATTTTAVKEKKSEPAAWTPEQQTARRNELLDIYNNSGSKKKALPLMNAFISQKETDPVRRVEMRKWMKAMQEQKRQPTAAPTAPPPVANPLSLAATGTTIAGASAAVAVPTATVAVAPQPSPPVTPVKPPRRRRVIAPDAADDDAAAPSAAPPASAPTPAVVPPKIAAPPAVVDGKAAKAAAAPRKDDSKAPGTSPAASVAGGGSAPPPPHPRSAAAATAAVAKVAVSKTASEKTDTAQQQLLALQMDIITKKTELHQAILRDCSIFDSDVEARCALAIVEMKSALAYSVELPWSETSATRDKAQMRADNVAPKAKEACSAGHRYGVHLRSYRTRMEAINSKCAALGEFAATLMFKVSDCVWECVEAHGNAKAAEPRPAPLPCLPPKDYPLQYVYWATQTPARLYTQVTCMRQTPETPEAVNLVAFMPYAPILQPLVEFSLLFKTSEYDIAEAHNKRHDQALFYALGGKPSQIGYAHHGEDEEGVEFELHDGEYDTDEDEKDVVHGKVEDTPDRPRGKSKRVADADVPTSAAKRARAEKPATAAAAAAPAEPAAAKDGT